jgi:hypothetical protein
MSFILFVLLFTVVMGWLDARVRRRALQAEE